MTLRIMAVNTLTFTPTTAMLVKRLLMNMYVNQSFQIKWNNIISSQSHISNEVKQGGCLSTTLFSVRVYE